MSADQAVTLTQGELENLLAAAAAKALASASLRPAAVAEAPGDRVTMRSVVQPKAPHPRSREAGVAEQERLEGGKQAAVGVRMDVDGALEWFAPSELAVLKAH